MPFITNKTIETGLCLCTQCETTCWKVNSIHPIRWKNFLESIACTAGKLPLTGVSLLILESTTPVRQNQTLIPK